MIEVLKTRIGALAFFASMLFLVPQAWSQAGYFELSANGSYYKYNNGSVGGELSTSINRRFGGGLAYNFLSNTSVELQYTNSRNDSRYSQQETGSDIRYRLNRSDGFQNLSLNLVLHLSSKGSAFRPYVTGGGGYMIRTTTLNGTAYDTLTKAESKLDFQKIPDEKSISANAGFGLKMYVAQAIALELSFTVFATDLDKETVYLHYSAAGGLRYLF
jgi:hypothetical protein